MGQREIGVRDVFPGANPAARSSLGWSEIGVRDVFPGANPQPHGSSVVNTSLTPISLHP
jgi:hypothetical protein